MRLHPSSTVLAAFLALAVLAALAWAVPVPVVTPAEAGGLEGQGRVRVEGQAQQVVADAQATRFTLHGGGASLDVRVAGTAAVAEGSWLRAEGAIGRSGGRLTLFVAGASDLALRRAEATVTAGGGEVPDVPSVPLALVAQHPEDWTDRAVRLVGTVGGAELGDGEGHLLRIDGPRLPEGPARVDGTLAYAPACVCYSFHPAAWTR